ncbi:MAG: hypothetical protein ABI601_11455 [bacterium]
MKTPIRTLRALGALALLCAPMQRAAAQEGVMLMNRTDSPWEDGMPRFVSKPTNSKEKR